MLIEPLVLGGRTVLILTSSSRAWIKILTTNVRLPSTPSISGPGSATEQATKRTYIENQIYNLAIRGQPVTGYSVIRRPSGCRAEEISPYKETMYAQLDCSPKAPHQMTGVRELRGNSITIMLFQLERYFMGIGAK